MQTNFEGWFESFFPYGEDRTPWRFILMVYTMGIITDVFIIGEKNISPLPAILLFSAFAAFWILNLREPKQKVALRLVTTVRESELNTNRKRGKYAAGRR